MAAAARPCSAANAALRSSAMAEAFEAWIKRQNDIAGIISAGGSGGASIVAPGDARSPDRRAEGAGVLDRLRRRRPLCRPDGHHDDVFGHRRPRPERHLAAGAGERRAGAYRDGEGAPQRARRTRSGESAPDRPSLGGAHHVRRHHALRAADHSRAGCGLGVPRLSRHRRRRPLHGEAGRLRGSSRRSSTSPPPKSPTC